MGLFVLKLLADGFWYGAIFGPFLFRGPVWGKAAFGAVFLAWGVWMYRNWEKRTLWENGPDRILFQGKVLAVVSLFELIGLGLDAWGRLCGFMVLGFLMTGILFLRAARLAGEGSGMGRAFLGTGLRDVLAVALATALLTSKWASEGALFLLGKGYQLLVLPVLLWILNLFLGILMGIAPLFSGLLPKKAGLDALSLVQPGEPPVFEAVEMGEPSMVWRLAGWALVAAALFAFLYLLYRKLSGNGYGKRERMEGALSREKAVSFASRTGKRRTLFGEHDVRYFYRKFLMLCKKKGLDMEANLTTAEVEQMARTYWKKEDTGELRDLYRKARYGRPGEREKDAADRRRAGELYREMKKEET